MSASLTTPRSGMLSLGGPMADVASDDGLKGDLRFGWIVIVLFFGLFMGWAAFARLDAAAYAHGQVAVAGHRQTLQHKEGGKVVAVMVKEGQHVEAGQVLVALDPGQTQALESATASQVISLEAERARLIAERSGAAMVRPAMFNTLTADEKLEADKAMQIQAQALGARRRTTYSQKAVLAQRSRQLSEQVAGFRQQATETDVQSRLTGEQVATTQDLVNQGYASTNRLKQLQMQSSGLRSQKADLNANAASAQAQMTESMMQAATVDAQRQEEVATALRDVENQLGDLRPKLIELKAQLAATQIRAPAAGKVVGLSVFNAGSVINPGQPVMDLVPDAAPMVVEAQVQPGDADDLFVGQETEIKVTAFHERNLPILKGSISSLSADSLVDQRTGARFFTAQVSVPVEEIQRLMSQRGHKDALRPGLPVEVLVPLRKRTALQYMFEPITSALWRSGREQ